MHVALRRQQLSAEFNAALEPFVTECVHREALRLSGKDAPLQLPA
jgi:hypothetical protein